MSFEGLGLSPKVLSAVAASGYTTPTPIQEQAIPHVLAGRDVLGIAQTGTGKTASFVLPMLSRLEKGRARARMPRTLILEPTRELAAQVEQSFNRYGMNHKLTVALLIGGVSFDDQLRKLDRGVDVLIATPGRMLDHFERGKLLMSGVEILVIDEADRMLDMGFIPDIERIAKLVPFTRQTLFFSATMPPEIERLVGQFLHNPVSVEVAKPATASATIVQRAIAAPDDAFEKRAVLRSLIDGNDNFKNAIIFCNRKTEVATLWRSLDRHGYSAGALHGDMDQRSRMAMLANFKEGRVALLVASDVAARGLDIPDVSHIFNFDVPVNAEDYIHRIGRTGRAGKSGSAFMIVTPQDRKGFEAIEALTGVKIEWQGEPVEWAERSRGRGRAPKGAAGKSAVARKDDTAGGRSRRPGRDTGRDTAKIEAVDGARADDSSRPVAVPHNQRAAAKSQNQRGGRPAVHADASKPGPKSGPGAKSGHGHAAKKQGTGKEPAFDDAHPFGGEDFVPAFLQRG